MSEKIITNTGQWTLVVLRVTQNSAKVWVGTLFPTLKMPESARVELEAPDGSVVTKMITKHDWQRPFRKIRKRFYTTVVFDNLEPGTHYRVRFLRRTEEIHRAHEEWQLLRDGSLNTLPARVPAGNKRPFTVEWYTLTKSSLR